MCDFPSNKELKRENSIIDYGLAITNIIPQSNEYKKLGHKVIIFTGGFKKAFSEEVKGFKVYHSRIPRIKNFLFGFGLLSSINEIEKKEGTIDLIVIHNPLTAAGYWPFTKLLGKKTAIYVHGTFTINNFFEKFICKKVFQKSDLIICISEPAKEQVISICDEAKGKIVIIRNGVDTELFKPSGATKNKIIFFGRNIPQKNLETFILASKIIKQKFSKIKIMVIGSKVKEKSIDFSGILEQKKIPSEISRSIVVFPYLQNTFGKTTPEAMAVESVVVGTNTDIPADIRTKGFFYNVKKAKDSNYLAKTIIRALKSNRIEIGRKARKIIVEKYSWKKNVEEQLRVISKGFKKTS